MKKPLDGLTILRFAHAYETGGGVELHLRDLNQGLSQRNALTTILVHLTKNSDQTNPSSVAIGGSTLIKVPLQATPKSVVGEPGAHSAGKEADLRDSVFKGVDRALFSAKLNKWAMGLLSWRKVPHREGEAIQAGAAISTLLKQHRVDLIVLHCNGGSDVSEVIAVARRERIPLAMVHHFSNDKLGNLSVRQQASHIRKIAGASHVGLPRYIRKSFTNLSDAVNLDFFSDFARKASFAEIPIPYTIRAGSHHS